VLLSLKMANAEKFVGAAALGGVVQAPEELTAAARVALWEPRMEPMYRAVTREIEVSVAPRFLEGESAPERNRFVWAYAITIKNHGAETVQLLSRHWLITSAAGATQEVRGPGVVGEQPVLPPGGVFRYTSGVPLTTPSGIMRGTYQMVNQEGEQFDVTIPAFSLDSEEHPRVVN
jgi:ApaG protein